MVPFGRGFIIYLRFFLFSSCRSSRRRSFGSFKDVWNLSLAWSDRYPERAKNESFMSGAAKTTKNDFLFIKKLERKRGSSSRK